MNPRHATANTTTKYIAVKMPTLMRSFPVSLPPVFDVEADAFPVVFMCEPFPVRLFSRRAFYEVSYIQQQSILANTHRAATPNSRACSKRPHVLQDGRVRFTTARDGAATAWGEQPNVRRNASSNAEVRAYPTARATRATSVSPEPSRLQAAHEKLVSDRLYGESLGKPRRDDLLCLLHDRAVCPLRFVFGPSTGTGQEGSCRFERFCVEIRCCLGQRGPFGGERPKDGTNLGGGTCGSERAHYRLRVSGIVGKPLP